MEFLMMIVIGWLGKGRHIYSMVPLRCPSVSTEVLFTCPHAVVFCPTNKAALAHETICAFEIMEKNRQHKSERTNFFIKKFQQSKQKRSGSTASHTVKQTGR